MKKPAFVIILLALILAALCTVVLNRSKRADPHGALPQLTVAIAPYQDLAMLVNAPKLGLDAKAGFSIRLVTMAWEDILPSVASAGKTVDVGFGSYVEYLTKFGKLNEGVSDPVLYIQPLYVYKGGGFIALSSEIAPFAPKDLADPAAMQRLRGYKIGAQKESLYDMMLYSVARRAGISPNELRVIDTPMNDGLLALETKSLDLASAGLTQVTEVRKRNGRLVISMEDAGFADVTGFICRKSTLENKHQEIQALIQVWFQCVDHVYADLKNNSIHSLDYLKQKAATKYTYEEYVQALSQEYLPRNLDELHSNVLASDSKYDFARIGNAINEYLKANNLVTIPSPIPVPLLGKP